MVHGGSSTHKHDISINISARSFLTKKKIPSCINRLCQIIFIATVMDVIRMGSRARRDSRLLSQLARACVKTRVCDVQANQACGFSRCAVHTRLDEKMGWLQANRALNRRFLKPKETARWSVADYLASRRRADDEADCCVLWCTSALLSCYLYRHA